jgi:sulfite oxidase
MGRLHLPNPGRISLAVWGATSTSTSTRTTLRSQPISNVLQQLKQCPRQSFSTKPPLLSPASDPPTPYRRHGGRLAIPVGLALAVSTLAFAFAPSRDLEAEVRIDNTPDEDCSKIRLAELPLHDRNAERKWVMRGTTIYDITDFIESHPGGEVILRACGSCIDPYWKIFSIHQKQEVYDVLNQYYLGDLDERDIDTTTGLANWAALGREQTDIGDPFKEDPERDPSLLVHTAKPCNAESPAERLADAFITPIKYFFVRNHLWVPRLDSKQHVCTIELPNGEEKTYSVAELKSKFREHTITATLQCAGNRRSHMSASNTGPTAGLQWGVGAISTANFTGVRLRDVLIDAGYNCEEYCNEDTKHIHLSAPGDTYTASVPSMNALAPTSDVLLAYGMNGQELPPDHGGPLRAIVPGTVAARSVKWVGKISFHGEEAWSQWQRRDYKCFGPNVRANDVNGDDWDAEQSIQETPVQSAITAIRKKNDGTVEVRGYAYSGGGRGIVRVDISPNGGNSWVQARLYEDRPQGSKKWAWTLWNITLPGPADDLVVKAVDDSYNSQPEGFDPIWNFRGLLATAWHHVKKEAKDVKAT